MHFVGLNLFLHGFFSPLSIAVIFSASNLMGYAASLISMIQFISYASIFLINPGIPDRRITIENSPLQLNPSYFPKSLLVILAAFTANHL